MANSARENEPTETKRFAFTNVIFKLELINN